MNENPSSPKKPVPKADIPNRSITSTTTDETFHKNTNNRDGKEAFGEPPPEDFSDLPHPSKTQDLPPDKIHDDEPDYEIEEQTPESKNPTTTDSANDPTILDDREQSLFLDLFARGASPQATCQKLGIAVEALLRTFQRDPTFQARRDQIEQLLSQNVAAALYRAAMEGNVSAQTYWLKSNPPQHWREDRNELPEKFQDLEKLSDDDLKRISIFIGEQVPQELA